MAIQFNSKDAKNFRTTMAKAHSAMGILADFMASKSDRVSAIHNNIRIASEDLDALSKGEKVTRTQSELEDYIKAENALLAKENDALKVAREDYNKAMTDALAMFPKSVYLAYVDYVSDLADAEKCRLYAKAIADALVNAGVKDATDENCVQFVGVVGKRRLKGKSAVKAQANTSAMSERVWRDLFVADLCDTLVSIKAISAYKYKYVFPTTK